MLSTMARLRRGLTDAAKRQLNARAVQEVLFEQITPGQTDYTTDLARLESAQVDVLFSMGDTRRRRPSSFARRVVRAMTCR